MMLVYDRTNNLMEDLSIGHIDPAWNAKDRVSVSYHHKKSCV